MKFVIFPLLDQGAENARSRRELCLLTGLTDTELRRQIHRERIHGDADHLILSSARARGYFKPSDKPEQALEEVKEFVSEMLSHAGKTRSASQTARKWLKVKKSEEKK